MSDKKKVKLWVTAHKYDHDKEFRISVDCFDRSSLSSCTTGTSIAMSVVEVEVEIPTVNQKQFTLEEVKQLQARIQKEKADSHVRVIAIEEKIQSLLCIEAG